MITVNEGALVLIKRGMSVVYDIPGKFVNDKKVILAYFSHQEYEKNKDMLLFSSCFYPSLITIGDILEQKTFSKEELISEFKKRTNDFFKLDDSTINSIIDYNPHLLTPQKFDTSSLIGIYKILKIYKTKSDERFAVAHKIINPSISIRFYLKSDLYPTIDDIEIIS